MNDVKLICLLLLLLSPFCSVQVVTGEETAESRLLAETLSRLPQPWKEKLPRLTREEYEATLNHWAEAHPQICQLQRRGVTAEGIRLFMLKISDQTVPDEDKQVCLITALHCGPERTGTTTIMKLAEWLLGEDPLAIETRRKQIVLLMPVMNPLAMFVTDRFGNPSGLDPYTGGGPKNWDLKTMTFLAGEKAPEVVSFLEVVDEYQPEVHADVHGIGLQEIPEEKLGDRRMSKGMTMFEVTGSAYSNFSLRPWDWRVMEKINQAGEAAGYGYDRFEADAQRMLHGPILNGIATKTWSGRANFYATQYAYAKYHTMTLAFEVGWEQSGVERLKGLLKIGNEPWQGEQYSGYPVNRVKNKIGHFVTAYGETAAARRRSRVELWNKQDQFSDGLLYPQTIGRDTFFVGVSPQAREIFQTNDQEEFLTQLEEHQEIKTENLRVYFGAGPEIKVVNSQGKKIKAETYEKIQHGMGLRLRIPYRKAELIDVRLNGHLLKESRVEGYQSWIGNGFLQLQINIPPEKTLKNDFFLVTVAYDPKENRPQGWQPPQAVVDRLKTK